HLLDPATDAEFARAQGAEVAGAQERALAVGSETPERLPGLILLTPVAGRDAGTTHPDLSFLALRQDLGRVRVDDSQVEVRRCRATADCVSPTQAEAAGV